VCFQPRTASSSITSDIGADFLEDDAADPIAAMLSSGREDRYQQHKCTSVVQKKISFLLCWSATNMVSQRGQTRFVNPFSRRSPRRGGSIRVIQNLLGCQGWGEMWRCGPAFWFISSGSSSSADFTWLSPCRSL
jgi:hypothetical protein